MAEKLAGYDYFKMVIGTLIIMGFLGTLSALFVIPIPIENKMAVDIILGTLGTLTVGIVQYLFGSSRGSKEKDAALIKAATQ